MIRLTVALVVALVSSSVSALEVSESRNELERVAEPPGIVRQVYDAVVLRPLGAIQVVVGAVLFVPSYPAALLVGGGDDVFRACLADPIDRTFRRPLGRL